MKTIQQTVITLVMLITICTNTSYSTIRNIMVSNFSFTPANINVTVGDTIKWTWSNGGHTTTCNGTNGTTRPAGAAPWNSDLNSGSPTFTYVIRVAGLYHYVCEPHAPDMAGDINAVTSSVSYLSEPVQSYDLSQNFPNPFNPVTNIKFSIPNSSKVVITVFNNAGKEMETLVNEKLNQGSYQVVWNAVNFTSGVYYYKIQTEGFIRTRKMLLIK